jgi:hypothetical protein
MPSRRIDALLTPSDRLRAIASILAMGVGRWRQQVKSGRFMHEYVRGNSAQSSLDLPAETSVSVAHGTQGLRPGMTEATHETRYRKGAYSA